MRRGGGALLGLTVLALVVLATPVAGAGKTEARTFVGRVSDTDAFVGVAIRGSVARAYVCDSNEISEWFNGEVSDGEISLTSTDDARLDAQVRAKRVTGTFIEADGTEHKFTAKLARGKAGFYRGEVTADGGEELLAGWVILPNGTQRGSFGIKGTTAVVSAPRLTTTVIRRGFVTLDPGGGLGITCSTCVEGGGGIGLDPGGGLG